MNKDHKMNASGNMNKAAAHQGFTLIELMVTLAIIAILASIALPVNLNHRQRSQVAEAMRMADTLRDSITFYYSKNLSFPASNKEAGVPESHLLIGNRVTGIEIEEGAIHITLGNKVSKPLQGKILSIRPAIVTGSPSSPVSWLCGFDKAVPGMEAIGKNKTDLAKTIAPASCGN